MLFEICALLTVSALIWQKIIPFESFLPDQTAHILFYVLAGVSGFILIVQQVFLRKRPDLKMAAPDQLDALKKKYFTFHLIAMAFADSIVVYGFVLFLTTGFLIESFVMMGTGALALISIYPTE